MSRIYTKKTERSRKTVQQIKHAVKCVIKDGLKIGRVAEELGFSYSSLYRHVQKAKHQPKISTDNHECEANNTSQQIFNAKMERLLFEYLQTCNTMLYSLEAEHIKEFVYDFAKQMGIQYPPEWDDNKAAGQDWLSGFMDRNKGLYLRQQEATSSTSFNKFSVGKFFDNLKFLLDYYEFPAENIFNLNEAECTAVHHPPRVIFTRGQSKLGQVTSAEKGKLITVCCFVNAAGETLPPAIIFPLKKFKDNLTINAPENTLGLAHPSGLMTKESFGPVMSHFIKYSMSSKENPCLLLLDNYESHVNIDGIALAKSNGVHLLTLPPRYSDRQQPLDVSVNKPFRACYDAAVCAWMSCNPGKTIKMYHLPALIKVAFEKATSRQNILSGFQNVGIHLLDADISTDADNLTSFVTDRENVAHVEEETETETDNESKQASRSQVHERMSPNEPENQPNITLPNVVSTATEPTKEKVLTQRDIKLTSVKGKIPKAQPRKLTNRRSKQDRIRISTDTSEEEELERMQNEKLLKTRKNVKRKALNDDDKYETAKRQEHSSKTQASSKRSKILDESESEDSDEILSTGESNYYVTKTKDFDHSVDALTTGDYVVIRFSTRSNRKVTPSIHYVGQVEKIQSNKKCLVKMMRKRRKSLAFFFPENEHTLINIDLENVMLRLSPPVLVGGSSRTVQHVAFKVNLSEIKNLR